MKKRLKIKKENFIKGQFKESFRYIAESKKFIFLAIVIFLIFALIGFFIPVPENIKNIILDYLKELAEKTKNFSSPFDWIFFIFFNNLISSFFGIILGFFLGIYPFLSSLLNGYIVGFVSSISVSQEGFFSLWRLFPHGIFELPALFISLGLGLKIGTFVLEKKKGFAFRNYLVNSLRVFIFVVFPLLLIAGIIEGFLIYYSLA
jgi:stage II sporulation protein M